jgi:hypothetical protein
MGMLRSQPDHHFGPSDRGTLSDNVAETTQGETEPIGDRLAGATCLPSTPAPPPGLFFALGYNHGIVGIVSCVAIDCFRNWHDTPKSSRDARPNCPCPR